MGFDYDGAWADYVAAPAVTLTRVPDGVPLEQAAILADAVPTPYAALLDAARVRPAETVEVWGAGGIATHLVQLARLPAARERAPPRRRPGTGPR